MGLCTVLLPLQVKPRGKATRSVSWTVVWYFWALRVFICFLHCLLTTFYLPEIPADVLCVCGLTKTLSKEGGANCLIYFDFVKSDMPISSFSIMTL